MSDEAGKLATEAQALVAQIKPLLAGRGPAVQSAVLADLLAIWLAGHVVPGDEQATLDARAEVLAEHLKLVGDLVGINAEAIGTDQLARNKVQ